jgi:predicted Zn-dependent protease
LPGAPQAEVSEADARAAMPVTEVDRFLGDYKTLRIKAGWPFTTTYQEPNLPAPASEGERLAQDLFHQRTSWPAAQAALREHYRAAGDVANYAHVTLVLADAFPFDGPLQFDTAAVLIQLGRPREAVRYSRRAIGLEPRNVNHWLVHAHGLLLAGRRDEGRKALQTVLDLEPANPTARQVLQELGQE